MKRRYLIGSIVAIIFLFIGIGFLDLYFQLQPYNDYIVDEFVLLNEYSVEKEKHHYLGKKPGEGATTNVYELEGLPVDEYLYITGGLYGDSRQEVVMRKTSQEPLLNYPIKKIERIASKNHSVISSIEDQTTINQLIALIKTENFTIVEMAPNNADVLRISFDLPCELRCEVLRYSISENETTLYWYDYTNLETIVRAYKIPSSLTNQLN